MHAPCGIGWPEPLLDLGRWVRLLLLLGVRSLVGWGPPAIWICILLRSAGARCDSPAQAPSCNGTIVCYMLAVHLVTCNSCLMADSAHTGKPSHDTCSQLYASQLLWLMHDAAECAAMISPPARPRPATAARLVGVLALPAAAASSPTIKASRASSDCKGGKTRHELTACMLKGPYVVR